MTTPRRRWIRLGGVLAVIALAVLAFDSNWLKTPVEKVVSSRIGRPFEIRGELDIVPRWSPRIVMTDVRLANPDWASEPETLNLQRADVSIALLPLFRGHVVLPEVTLTRPIIDLERSIDGANNWTFPRKTEDPKGSKEGEAPVIGRLTVDEGVLMFIDPAQNTGIKLEVATVARDDGSPGIKFHATGRYQGQKLDTEGTGGSMLSLADRELAYPLAGKFRIGATHGTVDGTITGLVAFAAADLELDVAGETLSELFPLIRVALPPTPPYRIKGRLIRDAEHWRFHDFDGRVGDSDLSGDADFTMLGERPRLEAKLTSSMLDLDDLGGFIGAKPQTGPGETASAGQHRAKVAEAAKPNALPDIPIKLNRLRAMDADVQFTGKSIRGKTPIDDLTTHLKIDNGVLTTRPLNFGVAGGNVIAQLALDGRRERAGVDANIEFKRIDLRKLFPGNATIARSTGLVGGRAVLKGTGNTFADVLGEADGTLGLAMSGGQISNLVIELAGLDVAEALRLVFRGDKPVGLRCAVADLDVRDGVVHSKSTIVDTTDTNIKIDGTVNLRNEEMDVTLHPLPKDYSIMAFRSPIHLRGTFKDPSIRPDEELLIRGGIAAVLGTIAAPLAALVALIETGPGDDADCERLIAAVERHVGAVPEAAGAP